MTGSAPAIDPRTGNVFAVTGNGKTTAKRKDWGKRVMALTADLSHVVSEFTPADYRALNNQDDDFGSGGVMLLPQVAGRSSPPVGVALGKSARMYLLNRNALGVGIPK